MLIAKKQWGMSLIEILIALLIASIVMIAVLAIFSNTMSVSDQVLQRGKLDRDLGAAMDVIVSDIQRAGYWANATSSSTNPFQAAGVDLATNGTSDCVTFTYDRDGNGSLSAITAATDDEHYGYRKSGGALQYRPPGASFTCTNPADWINLNDTNVVTITGFTVTITDQLVTIGASSTTRYRTVTITISGKLNSDTSGTISTISRTIKVYANKYTP